MNNRSETTSSFLDPSGGFVIWVFILCELLGFAIALLMFAHEKSMAPELFQNSRNLLNQLYGTFNTIILITSGFLVAKASKAYHVKNNKQTVVYLVAAIIFGVLFLILKGLEYQEKISLGMGLGHNTFFDYYWMLTAFHALHVVMGIIILLIMAIKAYLNSPYAEEDFGFETGCMFWHMCDLIWVLVFPTIYLL